VVFEIFEQTDRQTDRQMLITIICISSVGEVIIFNWSAVSFNNWYSSKQRTVITGRQPT